MEAEAKALVLWDGQCGFCRCCMAWVARHDREGRLRAVPFQEAPWPPMTPELYARCQQALHVLDAEGRLWRGGEACLFILEALGYRRLAACLWRWPLRWLVAAGYAVVARHRRFFSRLLRCAQAPA